MEFGGVLSKGEKKKYNLRLRDILEQSVICTESLIPYKNLFCLHKPVCVKLSHMAGSSFPSGWLTGYTLKANKRQDKQKSNEAPPWIGRGLTRFYMHTTLKG